MNRNQHKLTLPSISNSPLVLLLVDFINPLDFPGAEELKPTALSAAAAVAQLRRRTAGQLQVIFANDNFGFWQSNFEALYQRCLRGCPESREIAQLLKPRQGDFTVLKPRHSAFYSTPLELILRQLRCRKVILTGLAADSCVLFSAMDAYLRGYQLWVPEDCVAAEKEESKQEALNQMRRVLKAHTRPALI